MSNPVLDYPISPTRLFIELWAEASDWSSPKRTNALTPSAMFQTEVKNALSLNDAEVSYKRLQQLMSSGSTVLGAREGKVLHVMDAIDELFLSVHPRTVLLPASAVFPIKLPKWLTSAKLERRIHAHYAHFDGRRLIARGPLTRAQRSPTASYAEHFPDRFAALTVVPVQFSHADRKIQLVHRNISNISGRGTGRKKNADDLITLIPVAQDKTDLEISSSIHTGSGQHYVNFKPATSFQPSENFLSALKLSVNVGAADIAIAPEFVMNDDICEKLRKIIPSLAARPRLIVAGSGLTKDTVDGQPWNETIILNGYGVELWRHRKLWPAGINNKKCSAYGLPNSPSGLTIENTAADNTIKIIDLDNFGRCLTLICQDLEMAPLIDDVVIRFQPDWVLVPILDSSLAKGSWAHRRAFALSDKSQAKFVMVTSTSLAHYGPFSSPLPFGIAVGPRDEVISKEGRLCFEALWSPATPFFYNITWNSTFATKTEVK